MRQPARKASVQSGRNRASPTARKRGMQMLMRRRRPLMRAAMVGGVAYHAGKRNQQGQEEDYDRDARIAELEAQQAASAPAAAPAPAQDDMVAQLEKLARLKDQGMLTQVEVDAQK